MTRTLLAILGCSLVLGLAAGPAVPAGQPPQAQRRRLCPEGDRARAGRRVRRGDRRARDDAVAARTGSRIQPTVRWPGSGAATTSLTVKAGAAPSVQAGADISSISLFNGEITVDGMTIRAAAGPARGERPPAARARPSATSLALGQAVAGAPGASAALADWGTVTVLSASAERTSTPPTFKGHASVVGVHVVLTQPHGGLPAGSEILVGYADAAAAASPPAAPPPTTSTGRRPRSLWSSRRSGRWSELPAPQPAR